MPRKKSNAAPAAVESTPVAEAAMNTATLEPPTAPMPQAQTRSDDPAAPAEGPPKNWGPPYKAVFTAQSFELGENRRYKQRLFTFKDKPDEATIAVLKENGFQYRPAEKSWTVAANAESRLMSDRLAKQFAGEAQSMSR